MTIQTPQHGLCRMWVSYRTKDPHLCLGYPKAICKWRHGGHSIYVACILTNVGAAYRGPMWHQSERVKPGMQGRAGWDAVLPFIGYNKSIIVSVTMTLEDHSLSKYLDMVLLDQNKGVPRWSQRKHGSGINGIAHTKHLPLSTMFSCKSCCFSTSRPLNIPQPFLSYIVLL